MKPREEQIGECRLILGDCLEIMPTLGTVDHVITDPPYEKEAHRAMRRTQRSIKTGINADLDFHAITDDTRVRVGHLMTGLSKGWVLAFCQAEAVGDWRNALEQAGAKYKRSMIWVKPDSSPQFNGQMPSMGYESMSLAWCGPDHSHWNGGGRRGVFTYPVNPTDRNGQHPTEKPIALMKELVYLFSNAGQMILDPFMGSGTTGIACVQLDRKFVGIEVDQKYFDLACRRIERATRESGDIFMRDRKKHNFQDFFGDPKAAAQAIEKERVDE